MKGRIAAVHTMSWRRPWAALGVVNLGLKVAATATVIAIGLTFGSPTAGAQTNKGPPNALQGFSANRGKPVRIQAASLEVRDKDKVATFSGNVQVVQGDTTMRSKTLMVFYENDPAKPGVPVAQGGANEHQQIRRMEAKGGVVVTQKDQVATGDSAEFDMRTNVVTLIGNVVVTRADNVLRGRRLVVNLTTGVSNVESGPGERVDMLINPSARPDPKSGPTQGQPQRPARPN